MVRNIIGYFEFSKNDERNSMDTDPVFSGVFSGKNIGKRKLHSWTSGTYNAYKRLVFNSDYLVPVSLENTPLNTSVQSVFRIK